MFFENLETERLLLKNIGYEDRDFIFKQFSDPAINEFLFDAESMESVEEADELIAFYTCEEPRNQHRWILIDKQTGEKIGTCGFHIWNREEKTIEVGYDLQKAYQNKGLMTEAMQAVFKNVVPKLGVTRLFAHIAKDNQRSKNLAKKLGFAFYGQTEMVLFHGKEEPHCIFELRR